MMSPVETDRKKRTRQFPIEYDDVVKSLDTFTDKTLPLDILELVTQYLLPNTKFGIIIQVICEGDNHFHFCDLFDSSTGTRISRHYVSTPHAIQNHPDRTCVSVPIECARINGDLVLPIGVVFSDINGCCYFLTCKNEKPETFELVYTLESPIQPVRVVNSGWKFVYGFVTSGELLILYNDEQQMTFIWNIATKKPQCLAIIDQGYAYHISLMYNPLRLVIPSRMDVHSEYLTCIYDLSKYDDEKNAMIDTKSPDRLSPKNPEVPHLVYKKFTTILEDGSIAALSRGRLAIYEERNSQEKRETAVLRVLEKKIIEPLEKVENLEKAFDPLESKRPPLKFWFANATVPLNDTISMMTLEPFVPFLNTLSDTKTHEKQEKQEKQEKEESKKDLKFIYSNVYEEPASPLIPFVPDINWDDYHPVTHFKKTILGRADGEVYPTFYPNTNIFQMSNGWLMIPPQKKGLQMSATTMPTIATKEQENQCLARFQLIELPSNKNKPINSTNISEGEFPLPKNKIRSIVSLPGNEVALLANHYEEVIIYNIVTRQVRKIPYDFDNLSPFVGEKRRIYTDMFRMEPVCANRVPFLRMWQKEGTAKPSEFFFGN
jgi:hypothetical protein